VSIALEIIARGADRDYAADIEQLLADGEWRTFKEIAAAIGGRYEHVRAALDSHPRIFVSVTGEDAEALGRSPRAILYSLRRERALQYGNGSRRSRLRSRSISSRK
jgi:hypothetical protein